MNERQAGGIVYAVGIGPGDAGYLTEQAREAIGRADVVCGYTVYTSLIRAIFPEKELLSTGMREERARCREALMLARGGKTVAVVCSGDAGVYGMAGLLLEEAERDIQGGVLPVEIEVVPGVTAALSGAAILGAPLANDFCVISLSDLLTPWERIERRLACAAAGDFAICLYNPRSAKRPEHLSRACGILLETKAPDTVCGYVRNIGREGEEKRILSLRALADEPLDMFTTAFVGNADTVVIGGRMVTRRGYRETGEETSCA